MADHEPHTIDRAALATLNPQRQKRPRREGRGLRCACCRSNTALITTEGTLLVWGRHHGDPHDTEFTLERLIREMAPDDKRAALLAALKG